MRSGAHESHDSSVRPLTCAFIGIKVCDGWRRLLAQLLGMGVAIEEKERYQQYPW